MKALIVEDRPGSIQDLAEALSADGFEVEREDVGGRALVRAMEFRPDVIVVGVTERGSAGVSVAQTLGWVGEIPIIVVCGLPDFDLRRPFAGILAIRFVLPRPFPRHAFVHLARTALPASAHAVR